MAFSKRLLGTFAVIAGLISQASAGPSDIAVVVNPTNANASLNKAQLSALFKGKTSSFPDGSSASPINLPTENDVRQAFDKAVLNMTPDESKRFWIDSKIRSGAAPPPKMSSPAAVARHVAKTPSAIGYVPTPDAKGLKVVARIVGGNVTGP
jgi:ABC-type phosphate transport system substrate-binding protein